MIISNKSKILTETREDLYKADQPRVFKSPIVGIPTCDRALLCYILSEIEVAVFVTLNIDLVPSDLSKMNSEEALSVKSLVSVNEIYLAGELSCDLVELKNVGVGDKLDLVKVFAASFHNS